MTSAPVRDPLSDHLLAPENAAFLLIDYQPSQLAGVRSMDRDLLVKNAVSTVRTIKAFGAIVGGALLRSGPLDQKAAPSSAQVGVTMAQAELGQEQVR